MYTKIPGELVATNFSAICIWQDIYVGTGSDQPPGVDFGMLDWRNDKPFV